MRGFVVRGTPLHIVRQKLKRIAENVGHYAHKLAHPHRQSRPAVRVGQPIGIEDASDSDGEQSQETTMDVNWLQSFAKKLSDSHTNLHGGDLCTIYKVPIDLWLSDPNAYTPTVVRIGPYHYSSRFHPRFNSMENHKFRCLQKMMNRRADGPDGEQDLLVSCLQLMKQLEPKVRRCYSEEISLESNSLAEMMMLDGCFLLHLLLNPDEFADLYESQMHSGLWVWSLVKYDLLLLENQIPFFVIKKLFNLLRTHNDENFSLVDQALKMYSDVHPLGSRDPKQLILSNQVHHLLHLVYLSLIPPQESTESNTRPAYLAPSSSPEWIPSAKELEEAGIDFKRNKKASSFLDIKFSNGVMKIPSLEIHDYSKSLFRNLIAFEQCYPLTDCHITVYAAFMDCIINTSNDVRLLHLSGILFNRMSADQEATHFFSQLCSKVHYTLDNNYLKDVFTNVTKYHQSTWHKWRARLARDYFSNPWAIVSLGAAFFLLILTVTQTFFSVYSYFLPPK